MIYFARLSWVLLAKAPREVLFVGSKHLHMTNKLVEPILEF